MSTSKPTKKARDDLRKARQELAEVSKRDRAETDAYLKANDRVAQAEQNVPWWRR